MLSDFDIFVLTHSFDSREELFEALAEEGICPKSLTEEEIEELLNN